MEWPIVFIEGSQVKISKNCNDAGGGDDGGGGGRGDDDG